MVALLFSSSFLKCEVFMLPLSGMDDDPVPLRGEARTGQIKGPQQCAVPTECRAVFSGRRCIRFRTSRLTLATARTKPQRRDNVLMYKEALARR